MLVIHAFAVPSVFGLLASLYLQFTVARQLALYNNNLFYPIKMALFFGTPLYAFLTFLMIDWTDRQYAYKTIQLPHVHIQKISGNGTREA